MTNLCILLCKLLIELFETVGYMASVSGVIVSRNQNHLLGLRNEQDPVFCMSVSVP